MAQASCRQCDLICRWRSLQYFYRGLIDFPASHVWLLGFPYDLCSLLDVSIRNFRGDERQRNFRWGHMGQAARGSIAKLLVSWRLHLSTARASSGRHWLGGIGSLYLSPLDITQITPRVPVCGATLIIYIYKYSIYIYVYIYIWLLIWKVFISIYWEESSPNNF